jgi:HPt (histidine-containing phosphotransfer) domain-containing protein
MMKQQHSFYSYQYLFKISSTSPVFIKKMIALFLNSLAEYISDLERQSAEKQITDLHKIIHKLKPSVLSLEVKGAKEELAAIDGATSWSEQVQESVDRLLQTFKLIQPMMQKDLEEMSDV